MILLFRGTTASTFGVTAISQPERYRGGAEGDARDGLLELFALFSEHLVQREHERPAFRGRDSFSSSVYSPIVRLFFCDNESLTRLGSRPLKIRKMELDKLCSEHLVQREHGRPAFLGRE